MKPAMILPGVQGLLLAVDDSPLHQVDHAVRKQLGVHAEVLPVGQQPEHRVRHRADPGLQRGAVGMRLATFARSAGQC